uniref:non-specific serine/threonine protein kinase n=1 Tax=Romanomermis culicivorax TaxID=13658 RepID=A0A915HYX2_ROMCU
MSSSPLKRNYADDDWEFDSDDISDPTYETKMDFELVQQGAEARLFKGQFLGRQCLIKERFPKTYRHPILDQNLSRERTKFEIRCLQKCRALGIVRTPTIYFIDDKKNRIFMEYIGNSTTVKQYLIELRKNKLNDEEFLVESEPLARKIGQILRKLHDNNIIHGDLTTSNLLIDRPVNNDDIRLSLIDFGLSYIVGNSVEDKAVDLYVLERAFLSTHPNTEKLFDVLLKSYENDSIIGEVNSKNEIKKQKVAKSTMTKFEEVRLRGRKRLMIG